MNFEITTSELIQLHSLLETLPVLVSATVPTAVKQNLIQDAAGDEKLKSIASKAHLQLEVLRQKQEQNSQAVDLEAIEPSEFNLEATLKRLIEQQQSCSYERGWVLFRLEEATDFAKLTQEQWFTIAEELGFQRGWAWHQYEKHSNSVPKSAD